MAPKIASRTRETSATLGTGTLTLDADANVTFRRFSDSFADGEPCFYFATDGTEWERGVGTVGAAHTLARTRIIASSNANAAVDWAAAITIINSAPPEAFCPPGYAWKMPLTWLSTTTMSIGVGVARASDDLSTIEITTEQTIDNTATGSLGLNTLTSAVTWTTAGSATVTASADAWAADITAYRRTLTGTFAYTGTTLIGTSSKLLTEATVGDVVRVGANGGVRLISIASDTSAEGVAVLPGGDVGAGATAYVHENVTIKVGSETARRVNTINNAGTTLVMSGAAAGSTAGQAAVWGAKTVALWLFIYAATISLNGRAFFSTQRTTPYAIAGMTAFRRIALARCNTSAGDLLNFSQRGSGVSRLYHWRVGVTLEGTRVVNNGHSTTPSPFTCEEVVPPTSTLMLCSVTCAAGTAPSIQPRNSGTAAEGPFYLYNPASQLVSYQECALDGAQGGTYSGRGADPSLYVDVGGFVDELN